MKKSYFILSILLPLFSSCSDNENPSPGTVRLSSKEVIFEQEGNSVSIDTEGRSWWFNRISATDEDNNTTIYELTSDEKKTLAETGNFEAACGWLTVKCENHRINLHATENASVNTRACEITVQAGEYSDVIKGRQNGWMTGGGEDDIKLRPAELKFSKAGGTQTATAEDTGWGITQIRLSDGSSLIISEEDFMKCVKEHAFEKTFGWVTVKRDGAAISITAKPNATGGERSCAIHLQHMDNFKQLRCVQEG